MSSLNLVLLLLLLTTAAYHFSRRRMLRQARPATDGGARLNSLPEYYGMLGAVWAGAPALLVYLLWLAFEADLLMGQALAALANADALAATRELLVGDIRNAIDNPRSYAAAHPAVQAAADRYREMARTADLALTAACLSVFALSAGLTLRCLTPRVKARIHVERIARAFLLLCSMIAIFTTISIVLSVLFEASRFFRAVPVAEFLFGLEWSPQMAIREGQVGSSGAFGAVPLFAGTLLISFIAMLVAAPIGLMSAIYLSEYAGARVRAAVKPLLEILAGVPTVVYGFFAAIVISPALRGMGAALGLDVAAESALAAGFVMGVMIIPFVSSLSDDVISAVPQAMRDGSLAMGATHSETMRRVILPAALPGIIGGLLLAVSRAIGETMIVVMAAGLSANLTVNPLEAVTTVTVQIVTLLVGDQEFDSPKTLAAFALGLTLFFVTLALNFIALHVVRKYREQYE